MLDLGVQDTPAGSAAVALGARLPEPLDQDLSGTGLALAWSHRGAPHLHRPGDLLRMARALWPLSAADANARLAGFGAELQKEGADGREAMATTAAAVHDSLGAGEDPLRKGELSAAVTRRIPDRYSSWCRSCGSTHVHDQLLRLAALPGGAQVELPGRSPLTFGPVRRWRAVPSSPSGTAAVIESYLRLLGPASPASVAAFFATTAASLRPAWPSNLVEVDVDGRPAWAVEEELDGLGETDVGDLVRLLPPGDPLLAARDRELLVPDEAHRAVLWKNLGRSGAVLAGAAVVAAWQARMAGRRLELTFTPFTKMSRPTRQAVAREAERLATTRGAADVVVKG